MSDLLKTKLIEQSMELFELGIAKKAGEQCNISGDLFPRISRSDLDRQRYYFINLGYMATRSKLIPIGCIDGSIEQSMNATYPFNENDLIEAERLSEELITFCERHNIEYNIEFGV